jgi:hypothetical protein
MRPATADGGSSDGCSGWMASVTIGGDMDKDTITLAVLDRTMIPFLLGTTNMLEWVHTYHIQTPE